MREEGHGDGTCTMLYNSCKTIGDGPPGEMVIPKPSRASAETQRAGEKLEIGSCDAARQGAESTLERAESSWGREQGASEGRVAIRRLFDWA